MQKSSKKVGIIVPIYNVEKYLRQCLDSIIYQTYPHLEIILVNDGSTDSSLEIAKEYARLDDRIIIFDIPNSGQARVRNIGVEFLSGELAVESLTKVRQDEEILYTYIADNPHLIIYSLKGRLEIPQVEYLQFVDSDDYIELDCLEQCVPRMRGVDVLWFDAETFLDGVKQSHWKSNIWHFGYTNEVVISRKDWALRLSQRNLSFFYFSWSGLISFEFLKKIKLKFINGIIQEDDYFGILLFAQSNYIYVYPKKLYHYRIRANSIMNYGNDFQAKVPGFFAKHTEALRDNYLKRQYHKASSFMQTCLHLDVFLQNTQDEQLRHIISAYLMPTYVFYAYKILYFSKDPLNLIPKFQGLQEYLKNFNNHYLVNDSLKEKLIYRLGVVSLSSLRQPKKILSLPKILYTMIQDDGESQKAYKANIQNYSLDLPNFELLLNKQNVLKIKQHLSYKLGACILNSHKARFFGGYLWLPLSFAWTLISFKLSAPKRKRDSTFFNVIDRLNREISHLNWQVWSLKDSLKDSSDFLTKLQNLGIPSEFF